MSDGSVCKKSTGGPRHKITCSDCKKPCHASCVNLSKEDMDFITNEKRVWRCPPCSVERRKSMASESPLASKSAMNTTLSDVLNKLNEAADDRKRIEAEINKSFDFVNEQIAEQKADFNAQSAKLDQYLKLIDDLRAENVQLQRKVADLELRLEDSEQYQRSNKLEIQGIPESKNEDVYEVVRKVGVALDIDIPRESIDIYHRLKKKPGSDCRAGIIKFVRREVKMNILEKRRVKRNLNSHDVGYTKSAANPVYVNESLSPAKRRVLAAARTVKHEKTGKLFLRKNQDDPYVQWNKF